MRFFVTRGAGFIGSNYVRHLLATDPEALVTNFDKLTYAGTRASVADLEGDPRHTFVRGDICDAGLVGEVLPGHDVVVNFAAETHVDRSIVEPLEAISTNTVGVATLAEAARTAGVGRFVQVGTDEEYGTNNDGPYQFPEKVIPLFVTNLLDGHKVPLYGSGGNVRDWLYVQDHCAAIDLVLRRGQTGGIYNVGAGNELSNLELTRRILAAFGVGEEMIEYVPDRPGHDWRYSLDTARVRELGWAPAHDFDAGLAETIAWYRDHEDWWRPMKPAGATRTLDHGRGRGGSGGLKPSPPVSSSGRD